MGSKAIKVLLIDCAEYHPIPGYDGYWVAMSGQIASTAGDFPRILSQFLCGEKKYLRCKLGKESLSIHRALGLTFLDRKPGDTDINHKDGNHRNNDLSNLEWCTRRYNVHHAMRTGVHPNPEKAVVGYNDKNEGWWFISQAEAVKAGFKNVSAAVNRKRPRCKGFIWEFA